jgi:hypothetical protein
MSTTKNYTRDDQRAAKRVPVSVLLDPTDAEWLAHEASEHGVTISCIVRSLCRKYRRTAGESR